TTDHAKDVQATNAARDQAVAGLTGYQSGSSDALGRAQTLPVPPGMDLVTRAAGTGPGVSPVGFDGPRGAFGPAPGVPGAPGSWTETTGCGTPGPGGPFSGPGGPGAPGGPGGPLQGPGGGPGPQTGVGPVTPLQTPAGQGPGGLPKGVANPLYV